MELKDYWFSLKSHIYVEFKKDIALLYNTQNGEKLITESKETFELISQIYEPENLGVTTFSKSQQRDFIIKNFVQNALDKQMGNLTNVETAPNKPIVLVPILNLQKDVDKLQKDEEKTQLLGKDILQYLLEINIFVNDYCDKACEYCNDYCKQFNCCTVKKTGQMLSVSDLESIVQQIKNSPVSKINILGGNILKYRNLHSLIKLFTSFKDIVQFYIYYENYEEKQKLYDFQKNIIVNFPVKYENFEKTYSLVNKQLTTVQFIINNTEDFRESEKCIEKYGIENYIIRPFYTGLNIDFFKEFIFFNESDIFSNIQSMREIFRNKKLNSNFFGTLNILPDGTVKANMNMNVTGNIKEDSLLNIMYKELLENTAWRKTRNENPCVDCLYQFLCPPPSNYELVIGKPNLCNVNVKF